MPSHNFDSALTKVRQLVDTFRSNEARYLSPDYQEAEVRKDFIDKLWTAFGWDVNHDVQTNPYEQEVKVERGVHTGSSARRRADYAFYLSPNFHQPRFYVEAKKPAGDTANADDYFQAIRYGWNSQTTFAVLTDFKEFHVLDCRQRPDPDTVLDRCLAKYHYLDYSDPEKLAQVYWLFSREAVSDRSLEKRARELPKPRGKAVQRTLFPGAYKPVDESFLEDLDEYRLALARTFKTTLPSLDSDSLTELAQRTLDRLVFLRFLEDRGIEQARHVENFGDTGAPWREFVATSKRLDDIYNGVVFKRHATLDSDNFHVDDGVFGNICESLASVNTPYDFNSIPIHILGSIYERFLGKVIVATDKRVQLKEKDEVRHAGGVYYTPEYIVRYIVENTVGRLIKDKTPPEIAKMRFADIACGSGSFLLGIYDTLLEYHGLYYNRLPVKVRRGDCIERDGKLYLSLQKKREILTNNIFGVDIDPQAVEVAQLSLYLRLLKDETPNTKRQYQLEFAHAVSMRHLLPDLSNNIVCGNSLIGTDILSETLFAAEEERHLLPMDFSERFPAVMKRGGFDAVVGNPPYVRMETFKAIKAYLREHYQAHEERADYYAYFLERALGMTKDSGVVGMIVSNKFSVAKYGRPLREMLGRLSHVDEIADFAGVRVFHGATVRTFVLTLTRKRPSKPVGTRYLPLPDAEHFDAIENGLLSVMDYGRTIATVIGPEQIATEPWQLMPKGSADLLKRLSADFPTLTKAYGWTPLFGIKTGLNEAFVIDDAKRRELVREDRRSAEVIHPFLFGKDVRRYFVRSAGRHVIYLHPHKNPNKYPAVKRHLEGFKSQLTRRAASQEWYELQQPAVGLLPLLSRPKIVYPIIAPSPRFALDPKGYLVNDKLFVLPTDSLSLLGLLNSSLARFFFAAVCARLEGSGDFYYEYRAQFVGRFPVAVANGDKRMQAQSDRIGQLVEDMLEAHQRRESATTERDAAYYAHKAAAKDADINQIVHELYRLTPQEIAVLNEADAVDPDISESTPDTDLN